MSALRASNDFLSIQIGSHTMYMIQLVRTLLHLDEDLKKEQLVKELPGLRARIVAIKYNTDMFESFQRKIHTKYPDFEKLIEMACEVHVDYLCLRAITIRENNKIVSEPVKKLYLFLIQLVYTQPYLFISDDIEGTQYLKVKTAFQQEFLPTCIRLTYEPPPPITTLSIKKLA
jgi:hypothetical protein